MRSGLIFLRSGGYVPLMEIGSASTCEQTDRDDARTNCCFIRHVSSAAIYQDKGLNIHYNVRRHHTLY